MNRLCHALIIGIVLVTTAGAQQAAPTREDFERMLKTVAPSPITVAALARWEATPATVAGDEDEPSRTWLYVGAAVWGAGSAADIVSTRQGVEAGRIREGNPLLAREDGTLREPLAWGMTVGVGAAAAVVHEKCPRCRKPVAWGLIVGGIVRALVSFAAR